MVERPDGREDTPPPEDDAEPSLGMPQDARSRDSAAGGPPAEGVDRTPEPTPDRKVYFPRGWGCALLVLLVVLAWLLVGVLWNPEWWPFWREVRWGVGT